MDPAKVVRIALANAESIASVLLLTEATMTEIEEEQERTPPMTGIGMQDPCMLILIANPAMIRGSIEHACH